MAQFGAAAAQGGQLGGELAGDGAVVGVVAGDPLADRLIRPDLLHQPLAAIYNQAREQLSPQSLVVFCHDDVWLGDQPLEAQLCEALQQFDLIGVAGSRRLIPGQPTWWLQPDGRTWDHPHLLGAISHGDPQASEPIRFGPSPAQATLLDGVFLAARAGTLQAAGVRFDPAF
ncbi:MAG: hypothetical protein ACKOPS_07580, partial [Cyanobium sp.]